MKLGYKQEKWLKALESGKYKQGSGCLCNSKDDIKSYCCLGVGAAILGKEFYQREASTQLAVDGSEEFLEGYEELGLIGAAGEFCEPTLIHDADEVPRVQDSLAGLNDASFSFQYIAKYMRENSDNVFNKSM